MTIHAHLKLHKKTDVEINILELEFIRGVYIGYFHKTKGNSTTIIISLVIMPLLQNLLKIDY